MLIWKIIEVGLPHIKFMLCYAHRQPCEGESASSFLWVSVWVCVCEWVSVCVGVSVCMWVSVCVGVSECMCGHEWVWVCVKCAHSHTLQSIFNFNIILFTCMKLPHFRIHQRIPYAHDNVDMAIIIPKISRFSIRKPECIRNNEQTFRISVIKCSGTYFSLHCVWCACCTAVCLLGCPWFL